VPLVPTKDNQTAVRLFWDGRQTSVVDMVLNPVTNHKEMNIPDFETLIKKLNSISYYPDLFKKAYGDNSITKERIAFAMQGFIACLNTPDLNKENTRFAEPNTFTIAGIAFSTTEDLSPLEQQGLFLFHAKYNCGQCHKPDNSGPGFPGGGYGGSLNTGSGMGNGTFIDFDGMIRFSNNERLTGLMNIGLDERTKDKGLGNITGMAGDDGLFKIPTLHNISVTAPYMHDGRYANLNEVLDHYSHNIKNAPNLVPLFKNVDGTAKNMNISSAEKVALIAFLNTLKDEDFLNSPMYSDPFK
jgi:cytochrome c peroxidase